MKKLLIIFTLMISTALICQECGYEVEFEDQKESFTLFVKTAQKMPSMGNLVIQDLTISKPKDPIPGVIAIDASLDADSAHLPAFGFQKGFFTFFKGVNLPQVGNGQYEIIINGSSCGYIVFSDNKGEYFSLEKNYQ